MAAVTAQLGNGNAVEIQARQLAWRGDEPRFAGGTDTGPTPYELLLGGLAACIALTLRLYANHKAIGLDGVDVRLELDQIHADGCVDCDARFDGRIDRIQTRPPFMEPSPMRSEPGSRRWPGAARFTRRSRAASTWSTWFSSRTGLPDILTADCGLHRATRRTGRRVLLKVLLV